MMITRTLLPVLGAALWFATGPTTLPVQADSGFEPDLSLRTPGLDVSHYQGDDISWTDLKADGLKFVFIKASEGVSLRDPDFLSHVAGADRVDLPAGAYHFFQLGDPGIAQADFFLRTIAGQSLALPPVLDLEGRPNETDFRAAVEWLSHVKTRTGCQPVLYVDEANYHAMAPMLDTTQPIWLAAYTQNLPATGLPPALWFWQHTPRAEDTGISGHIDSDWFFGTPDNLKALACPGLGG